MIGVRVRLVRCVDPSYAPVVDCRLEDAWGKEWTFLEKVPVVSLADLDEHSDYPQPGAIACAVVRRWRDEKGRELATIDTEEPWHCQATSGETQFDVLPEQLVEYPS
jgi:hypothetical protein